MKIIKSPSLQEEIFFTHKKDEDGNWFSYTVPRPMEPERYNTILVNDSNLIDYFKKYKGWRFRTCD